MPQIISKQTKDTLIIGLLFGLASVLINLFLTIPINETLSLSLGMSLCFYVLITFGTRASAFTLLFTLSAMFAFEQELLVIIVSIFEFVVIAYLLKKGCFVVIASFIFWIIIVFPYYWAQLNILSVEQSYGTILVAEHALNGLLNASLATTLYFFTPTKWAPEKENSLHNSLSSNIFALSALMLILPLVFALILVARNTLLQNEKNLVSVSRTQAENLSSSTEHFIQEHYSIVKQLAHTFSVIQNQEERQKILIDTHNLYPNFFNLTLIQSDGYTAFFAPARYNNEIKSLPPNLRYVNDRMYFKHVKDTLSPYMSEALMSRGQIAAPMIALASPIIKNQQFSGLILGAMNLEYVANLLSKEESKQQTTFIITDSTDQIIYASASTKLNTLDKFTKVEKKTTFMPNLPALSIAGKTYYYHLAQNRFAWKIYILNQTNQQTKLLSDSLLNTIAFIVVPVLLFLFIARKISNEIASPLVKLLSESTDKYTADVETDKGLNASNEINQVAAKLRRSHNLSREFDVQVKQQVTEKTAQLEQLNLQLAAQAREDSLTHVLNRNGFEQLANNAIKTNQRLNQPISLALLDIDHFELINDSYGHAVGDECLKAFTTLMQSNCKRETDIIGRYGGEEFVILMSGNDAQSHHQLIHEIHQQTQAMLVESKSLQTPVSFTVSIGVCSLMGQNSLSLQDVFNIADEELYKCKHKGRNQISIVNIDSE